MKLVARLSAQHLPAPISGEALTPQPSGLLVIGGLDSSGVSTSGVLRLDSDGKLRSAGRLAEPLHDAAAATLPGGVLVFGGGSAATIDRVESLAHGQPGRVIGRLPTSRSDLSSMAIDGSAYVLAGYDGQTTVGSVLRTSDGQHFAEVAQLPTPVRYAAVATLGNTVYLLGGELADGQDFDGIQAFDVGSHHARMVGHLPQPVSHASAVELGGRIYLLGGRRAGSASDLILKLGPRRGRATVAGHLPLPVSNAAAATAAGTGYLIGGLDARGVPLSSIVTVGLG